MKIQVHITAKQMCKYSIICMSFARILSSFSVCNFSEISELVGDDGGCGHLFIALRMLDVFDRNNGLTIK